MVDPSHDDLATASPGLELVLHHQLFGVHHEVEEVPELLLRESLGEGISKLKIRPDRDHDNASTLNLITNEVETHFNVLGALAINRVLCELHTCFVVLMKRGGFRLRETKLIQDATEKHNLLRARARSDVFCLSSGESNNRLKFQLPADGSTIKVDDKTRLGFPLLTISRIVHIGVRWQNFQPHTMALMLDVF